MKSTTWFKSLAVTLLFVTPHAWGDTIATWNAIATQAASNAGGNNGTGANGLTRSVAISQLAVYDAVNSITPKYQPYLASINFVGPADTDAAVIEASYQSLSQLIPSQAATLLAARNAGLAAIPDSPAKTTGITVGATAASNLIAARTGDGAPGNIASPGFLGSTAVGQWRPTPGTYGVGGANTFAPVNLASGANPVYSSVKPFGLPSNWKSDSQFAVPAPPAIGSPEYLAALAEVQSLGAASSVARTADQTEVAQWWYPASTITWNDIARTIIASQNLSPQDAARDLALVNIALQDSRIAAWNGKYDSGYNLWRPITSIPDATNPNQDPAWQPLLPTPNHPSYVSGHGTSGGAAAEVLRTLFGDSQSFTISSPSTWLPSPGSSRSFTSITQAEQENNDSRIYAGVHYRFDQNAGTQLGNVVGRYVANNLLTVPEPSTGGIGVLVISSWILTQRRTRTRR